jgi:hypothetical protein
MAVNYNIPFQTQLDYMMQELRGPESATMDAFKSAGAITPQDYAELFEQKYERAGGSALDRRKQYALEVFKGMGQEAPDLPQNVIRAYKYFTDQGFTPEQASGIVGNLMTESYAHLDPNAYNPAGGGMGAYGIAQFRGSRLKGLLDFAGQQGDTNMDQTVRAPLQASMGGNQQSERGAMSKLRGLLDFASERNPETGLSRFEQFAAALDPLIMPDMRAGEAIQQRGAQRVQSARTNKTIEWLKANGYEDIAAAVEANPKSAANVMSAVLAQRSKGSQVGDTSMIMTGAEVMKLVPGVKLNPNAPYTVKRKGGQIVDIDAVGGMQPELTPFAEEAQKGDVKDLREIRNVGRAAERNMAQVERLGSLLDQTDTGIMAGLASRANALGLGDFRGDAAAAAEAIISQLVPAQRPPGSGTISDADLALYKASLPSIAARPGGNKLIIESMIALLEHDRKVGEIAQKALDQTITPSEAYSQMSALPNPFANVRTFFNSAPTETSPLDRGGAMDILKQEGVID